MANITTYLEDKLLDHALGSTSYTMPTCYLALFTVNPTLPAGTGGTEVSGGSYARLATGTNFAAAAAGSKATNAVLAFAAATADWGLVTGVGVYDALTSGNLLFSGALTESKSVYNGDTFQFNSGSLTATLS